MKKGLIWSLPTLLGLALLVACAQAAPTPTPTPSPIPTPTWPAGAEKVVDLAKESLAKNLNVTEDKVKVVSVQEIPVATPPAAPTPSAGATPEPTIEIPERQFYVVLEVDGKTYEYQGGSSEGLSPTEPGPSIPVIPAEASALVEKAIKDLAQRQGTEEETIVPMRAEPVTWPDESLGVTEKGRAYLPKLTPGFLIILASPEGTMSYHSDLERVVFAGLVEEEGTVITPRDGVATALIKQAKEDLSRRLSLGVEAIVEVKVEALDWPDSSLGLGGEGAFLPVLTPGYRITLRAQSQQHVYHTDLARVVYAGTAPS